MRHMQVFASMGAVCLAVASARADIGDQLFKLLAADGDAGDNFGVSVDVSGNIAIAGAWGDGDNGFLSGSAYLFDISTGSQIAKLVPDDSDSGDEFGAAAAIDGDFAVVGARRYSQQGENNIGRAYVFDTTSGALRATLVHGGANARDDFGASVGISGETVIVGAPGDSHDNSSTPWGTAFLFDATSGAQIARLVPDDIEPGDFFGEFVAIRDGLAIASSTGDDDAGTDEGAVYIFDTRTGQQLSKILPSAPESGRAFGRMLAIGDGFVLIGKATPFTLYIFDTSDPINPVEVGELVTDDGNVPTSLSADALTVVGGLTSADGNLGAAYVFDMSDLGSPRQIAKLEADDRQGQFFGNAVGVDGARAVVGAVNDGDNGAGAGAAYVFVATDPDTDGDGLLDSWETDGIPYLGTDGNSHRYVLDIDGDGVSDADPNHKDLFLEIDLMAGLTFSQDVIDDVEFAFAAAPVENPDLITGINLHILLDDNTIPFEAQTETPVDSFPVDAGRLKFEFFGTQAERDDPDALPIFNAKSKAFRYAMVMNEASREIGGHAEPGGDDMILYTGGYPDVAKAAVLMHELGHLLGLGHGGGDNVNGKLNYPSIMNYVLAYKGPWNETFWKLDYSREKLATIDENSVSELVSVGSGGNGRYDNFFMPFHGIVPLFAECYEEILWEESLISYADLDPAVLTDLDLDCDTDDTGFAADLNFVPGSALPGSEVASPGETLVGFNDWEIIVLPVSDGNGVFNAPADRDELTLTQLQYMHDNFPPPPSDCLADWDGDGSVNTRDVLAFLNSWNARDPESDINGDGYIDTRDVLVFLNAWTAGC